MSFACDETEDSMVEFLLNRLSGHKLRNVEDHLKICPICLRVAELAKLTLAVIVAEGGAKGKEGDN